MQTEEKQIRWADFDIESPTSGRLSGAKVHAFKPVESKYWLHTDMKHIGYSHTYTGNKSLCGKFQLFDENERIVSWQDMPEHSEADKPENKLVCLNCLRVLYPK